MLVGEGEIKDGEPGRRCKRKVRVKAGKVKQGKRFFRGKVEVGVRQAGLSGVMGA